MVASVAAKTLAEAVRRIMRLISMGSPLYSIPWSVFGVQSAPNCATRSNSSESLQSIEQIVSQWATTGVDFNSAGTEFPYSRLERYCYCPNGLTSRQFNNALANEIDLGRNVQRRRVNQRFDCVKRTKSRMNFWRHHGTANAKDCDHRESHQYDRPEDTADEAGPPDLHCEQTDQRRTHHPSSSQLS